MREIKFRAWDTRNEFMVMIDDMYWFEENYCHVIHDGDNDYDYVIQQFIGLKDKNGVEIYEGDILKCYDKCTRNETVTPAEGTVVWSNEPADGIGFLIKTKRGLWDFDCLDIQVIGNIFEGINEKLRLPTETPKTEKVKNDGF